MHYRGLSTMLLSAALISGLVITGCGGSKKPPRATSYQKDKEDGEKKNGEETKTAGKNGEAAPQPGGWATLTGSFVLASGEDLPEDPKIDVNKDQEVCGKCMLKQESLIINPESRGIKNVVIYVRTADVAVHPDLETAGKQPKIDNDCCRFEPRILVVRTGAEIILGNSDPIAHNTNIQPLGDQAANPLIPAEGMATHTLNREQRLPVPVSCNIHPWMKGFILPRANPYAVVSDKDGKFELKNLPAGVELEFQVWHEQPGYLIAKPDWKSGRFSLTLKADETREMNVEVPLAKLKSSN